MQVVSSGALVRAGEPVRQFVTPMFWAKMIMMVVGDDGDIHRQSARKRIGVGCHRAPGARQLAIASTWVAMETRRGPVTVIHRSHLFRAAVLSRQGKHASNLIEASNWRIPERSALHQSPRAGAKTRRRNDVIFVKRSDRHRRNRDRADGRAGIIPRARLG